VEGTRFIHPALGHQEMEVGVKIDPVAKCLNGGDDPGHEFAPRDSLKITIQGAESQAAELPQQPAVVAEEDAEHLGDGEDDLAVRDIQKECLPHPLSPFLEPLRVTRWTESPRAAGEHQESLLATVRTADSSKPAAGVAAVEASLRGAKRRGNLIP